MVGVDDGSYAGKEGGRTGRHAAWLPQRRAELIWLGLCERGGHGLLRLLLELGLLLLLLLLLHCISWCSIENEVRSRQVESLGSPSLGAQLTFVCAFICPKADVLVLWFPPKTDCPAGLFSDPKSDMVAGRG